MEDQQIIALYFSRDHEAIKQTDVKYGKLCYSVANGILHRKEDNEECVNDTYLAAWNAMPPQRPQYLSSFLCRITRNLSLKKYEKLHAQKRGSEFELSLEELQDVLPSGSDVHSAVESKELGEAISRFLYSLRKEERNVFIKRYWYFDPIKSIAADYSYSESKVKSLLSRLRARLKEFLEKENLL
ncbi:MAG: sigma-70 family RNA polymerase sigma factor [Clostridia bacterium]|nr:sigma-70 family RNA polymerase sigma factor [Clostridia bacterium]